MSRIICLMCMIFSLTFTTTVVRADTDNEESVACGAAGAAIGAAVGFLVFKNAAAVVERMATAAGAVAGFEATKKCKNPNPMDWDYDNYRWPPEYDDFVRDQCGGNPLTCPGNFNIHDPAACQFFTTCMMSLLPQDGFSFDDIAAAVYDIHMSAQLGQWNFTDPYIDPNW